MIELIPAIILLPVAFTVVVYVRKVRRAVRAVPVTSGENQRELLHRMENELRRKSYFYHLLSEPERALFVKRTWLFFHVKEFEARGFDEVSFHMKVIISSYAAQITFGLDSVRLQHFRAIIVYPQAYQSTVTNRYHKGETHREGAIVFSWSDLREGHNNPVNGVNLALHEFAHALRLENITPNNEYGFLSGQHLQQFDRLAKRHIEGAEKSKLLRDYAFTNVQEFFAVCVENYFERPKLLQTESPELYALLREVLRLDLLQQPVRLEDC